MSYVATISRSSQQKTFPVGVFGKDFNVDKQMVPYFGRQFCKMFLRDNNKFD